jgi:hypothetical protein
VYLLCLARAAMRVTFPKSNFLRRISHSLPKHKKTDHGSNWTVEQAALYGLSIHENNGIYNNGYKFDVEKKLSVKANYQHFKEANVGLRPNLTHIARYCKVSPNYMNKINNEMCNHGRVLYPDEKKQKGKIGPGANSLDALDTFSLLVLYLTEDTRTLRSYAENLFLLTGMQVSESTISRFFNHAFPIKGGLRKPNLVPCGGLRTSRSTRR